MLTAKEALELSESEKARKVAEELRLKQEQLEQKALERCLNYIELEARSGRTCIRYPGYLVCSANMVATLQGLGYTVHKEVPIYKISWGRR